MRWQQRRIAVPPWARSGGVRLLELVFRISRSHSERSSVYDDSASASVSAAASSAVSSLGVSTPVLLGILAAAGIAWAVWS